MTISNDLSDALCATVRDAAERKTPLVIYGGGSKAFYGRRVEGEPLAVAGHRGIVHYAPSELVLSARAGTPLNEIEAALAQAGQMLPFEPPHFGAGATLGGCVACGLSGPRRPHAGSVRDYVLGVTLVNGRGEHLRFGGEVMKNVAGYDVSRLMTGALGTLGVLLDVSLKLLPRPEQELTLALALPAEPAIAAMNAWAATPLPLSACCHDGERLVVRLSGAPSAVRAAHARLGGEPLDNGADYWGALREHAQPFFAGDAPLWRLSLPPATPPLDLPGAWLIDWGGAQRWLRSDAPDDAIRRAAAAAGGHATLFRGGDRRGEVFAPLSDAVQRWHRNLKQAFDPAGILNRGKMYSDI
ncbi:MAG TPA: glycolate oxidase subunit GlcE [Acidiferrobacterales bacterium]